MTDAELDSRRTFAMIPHELLTDSNVPAAAIRVFGVLHRFGKTPETCFPSIERVAEMAALGKRSVERSIRALEIRGWVKRVARFTRKGLKTSNGYVLADSEQMRQKLLSDAPKTTYQDDQEVKEESPAQPDTSDMGGGCATSGGVDAPKTTHTYTSDLAHERESQSNERSTSGTQTTHARPAERPPRSNSFTDQATDDAGFREFREVYPKPVKLKAARAAFRSALGRASAEDIILGAKRYAGWCEREGEKLRFVDDPADWLAGDRWAEPYQSNKPKDPWWEWVETEGAQTARTPEELAAIGLAMVDGALVSVDQLGTVGAGTST